MSLPSRAGRALPSAFLEPLIEAAEVGRMLSPRKPLSPRRVRELVQHGSRGVRLGYVQTPSGKKFTAVLVAEFLEALTVKSQGRGAKKAAEVGQARMRLAPVAVDEVGRYPAARTGWAGAAPKGQMVKGSKGQMKGSRPEASATEWRGTREKNTGTEAGATSAGCTGDAGALP